MKAVLLLSDGIDSPVAGCMMKRLGVSLTMLHFGERNTKVDTLARTIDPVAELHVMEEPLKKLLDRCNPRYRCVLCKRGMYRAAETLCISIGADYIVTGESLGQVASQTLENMSVLDQSVSIPVLRPLLGFDKVDTIKLAEEFGTFDISIKDQHKCPYVPKSPLTMARLDRVLAEEAKANG
jgi:tRNA uracil 4-sulfurtransferase